MDNLVVVRPGKTLSFEIRGRECERVTSRSTTSAATGVADLPCFVVSVGRIRNATHREDLFHQFSCQKTGFVRTNAGSDHVAGVDVKHHVPIEMPTIRRAGALGDLPRMPGRRYDQFRTMLQGAAFHMTSISMTADARLAAASVPVQMSLGVEVCPAAVIGCDEKGWMRCCRARQYSPSLRNSHSWLCCTPAVRSTRRSCSN